MNLDKNLFKTDYISEAREILDSLDELAKECNYSRNELINIILEYGVNNIEIK